MSEGSTFKYYIFMNLLVALPASALLNAWKSTLTHSVPRPIQDPELSLADFELAEKLDAGNADIYHHRGQVRYRAVRVEPGANSVNSNLLTLKRCESSPAAS